MFLLHKNQLVLKYIPRNSWHHVSWGHKWILWENTPTKRVKWTWWITHVGHGTGKRCTHVIHWQWHSSAPVRVECSSWTQGHSRKIFSSKILKIFPLLLSCQQNNNSIYLSHYLHLQIYLDDKLSWSGTRTLPFPGTRGFFFFFFFTAEASKKKSVSQRTEIIWPKKERQLVTVTLFNSKSYCHSLKIYS